MSENKCLTCANVYKECYKINGCRDFSKWQPKEEPATSEPEFEGVFSGTIKIIDGNCVIESIYRSFISQKKIEEI